MARTRGTDRKPRGRASSRKTPSPSPPLSEEGQIHTNTPPSKKKSAPKQSVAAGDLASLGRIAKYPPGHPDKKKTAKRKGSVRKKEKTPEPSTKPATKAKPKTAAKKKTEKEAPRRQPPRESKSTSPSPGPSDKTAGGRVDKKKPAPAKDKGKAKGKAAASTKAQTGTRLPKKTIDASKKHVKSLKALIKRIETEDNDAFTDDLVGLDAVKDSLQDKANATPEAEEEE